MEMIDIPKPNAFFIHKSKLSNFIEGLVFECECIDGFICYGGDDNGVEMQLCKSEYAIEPTYLQELKDSAAEYNKQNESND
jgi:hypothetical protein